MKKKLLFLMLVCYVVLSGCITYGAKADHVFTGKYQCVPCGSDCDNKRFDAPGECKDCGMKLVETASVGFSNIEASDICHYIEMHPGVILLDVRTKKEFEGQSEPYYGTLKNALNIPIQELEGRMGELSAFKDKEIVVYCSHSHRSPRAAYMLTQKGFTHVKNMAGGMSTLRKGDCVK